MARTFLLEIVTPEKIVFSEEVESLVVPAHEGYLGVLAGHAPLLATINPGEITIRNGGGEKHFSTGGGFVEVQPKKTVVLSESAERADEIVLERALKAREKAKETLKTAKNLDRVEAENALARAEARIRAAQRRGK